MKDEKGEIIQWVGTCTDIDDQLRANELLEKTVAERTARLQELVEELQAFAYSISHDLRAPLRVMKGFSNILKEEYGAQLDEKANGYLDRISLSSHRMSELIKDVLNYSTMSLTDLVIVPIHPGNLIAEIVSTYPNLGSSEIDISIAETFPLVLANESALNQCVSNILSNAMKFVEAGVKPHVKVWGEQNAGMIRLWFKDNGIGIAREDFERVFDIFHRVNGTREGTGIGLAIVKQAVERMGGNVGLESELGRGTSFWLELPSAPP
jgi:signal transduction histidine kinase